MKRTLVALSAVAIGVGCSGKTLDAGSDGSQNTAPTPIAQEPIPEWPSATCATEPSPLVGTWSGYTEAAFLSTFDTFRLKVNGVDGSNQVCGSVTFGAAGTAPPAPASDPGAAYPSETASPFNPWPGFAYTMMGGTFSDGRLRFRLGLAEVWRSWCALQSPCLGSQGLYGCIPNAATCDDSTCRGKCDGRLTEFTQPQVSTCTQVCTCDATHCDVAPEQGGLSFDIVITGTTGDGSMGQNRVRLERVE